MSSSNSISVKEEDDGDDKVMTKEDLLLALKKKLEWACAHELAPQSGDPSRQLQPAARERVMLEEMEKIIWRIKAARRDYAKAEEVFKTNLPPVASQSFACIKCGNRNNDYVFNDPKTGDSICRGIKGDDNCGEVIQDHSVDRGAAKRNFSDDEKNHHHHGPASNPFMPDSVNMRTSFSTVGPNGEKLKKMKKISDLVEMGISNLGHDGRASTRTGYKTNQKNEAFRQMAEWASSYLIHDKVVETAKGEFAKFREVREKVEKFLGVVAGCLVLAYEELSATMSLERKVSGTMRLRDDLLRDEGESYSLESKTWANDIAASTVKDKKIAIWELDDVKEWLNGIIMADTKYKKQATKVVGALTTAIEDKNKKALDALESANAASVKAKVKVAAAPSCFNTTTKGGRAASENPATANGKQKLTAGRSFLELRGDLDRILKISSIGEFEEISTMLRVATDRRARFEIWNDKQMELRKRENERMKVEALAGTTRGERNEEEEKRREKEKMAKAKAKVKEGTKEVEVEEVEEVDADEEDLLADLLGDDMHMPADASSAFDNVGSSSSLKVKKPNVKPQAKPVAIKKEEVVDKESEASSSPHRKKIKFEIM